MAKTKKGKKIVSVHPYPRTKSDGSITVVKGHRRSTPCKCKHKGDSRREEYPPGFSIQIPKELLPNKDNIYIVYGCW